VTTDAPRALKSPRSVYLADIGDYRLTPVYDRYLLGPGSSFTGPAIVEERESTLVVGAASRASVDEYLNLIVRCDDAR
jgi:N-methylhydantoinase A